jgi:hypothetical protein
MARNLHFPADLNLDNARPLAPQWMTNQQEAYGAGTQTIKSALVCFPAKISGIPQMPSSPNQACFLSSHWAYDQGLPQILSLCAKYALVQNQGLLDQENCGSSPAAQ